MPYWKMSELTITMTTSNSIDLASFEPEAILASLPGEHPKMTAALGVGRELENTGVLDTATLTQLVNDLYAEGFPATAPFAAADFAQSLTNSHTPQPSVPATDSLTTKLGHAGGNSLGIASPSYVQAQGQPVTQEAQSQQLTYAPGVEALGSDPLHNHPAHLNVLQPEAAYLAPSAFAGLGIEIPYQQELDRWLGSGSTQVPASAASSQPASNPSEIGRAHV